MAQRKLTIFIQSGYFVIYFSAEGRVGGMM